MFSVKKLSIAVGTMAIGLGSIAPVNAASFYEITGLDFSPSDINDSAQVVGEKYLWQNGNVTDLTTLPGANNSNLSATAINNKGAIVGNGFASAGTHSFISNGSTISGLTTAYNCGEFCAGPYRVVQDINDSGTLAIYTSYGFSSASITVDSNGTITNFDSGKYVGINSINNQEQVVGYISYGINESYGFFSDNKGQITNLEPAARPNSGSLFIEVSRANDIDDAGNIVGSGLVSPSPSYDNTAREATLWEDPNQPGVSLGTLGGENSEAFGINNLMQVVGSSFLEDDSTQHAFLWEDDQLIDLNSLVNPETGWELNSAFEINNNGDIIGVGTYNGEQRGFIAKAVPEPSSVLGVLGLGVFGLGSLLKRKQFSR